MFFFVTLLMSHSLEIVAAWKNKIEGGNFIEHFA